MLPYRGQILVQIPLSDVLHDDKRGLPKRATAQQADNVLVEAHFLHGRDLVEELLGVLLSWSLLQSLHSDDRSVLRLGNKHPAEGPLADLRAKGQGRRRYLVVVDLAGDLRLLEWAKESD